VVSPLWRFSGDYHAGVCCSGVPVVSRGM
jgi:hypothetical protein